MKTYRGRTQDASSPILGAEFWKKGTKVEGIVSRSFETKNGECFELLLKSPITVNGEKVKAASIGSLKGFEMALQATGVEGGLLKGDLLVIECTGVTKTDKGNPRVDFKVDIGRED